jgi:hypothetical protein
MERITMSYRPSWQKSWLPLSDAELWHFYRLPDRATILRHVAAWRYPRDAGRQSLFINWHRECCPIVIAGFVLTDQTLEFLGGNAEDPGEFWLTEEEGERLNTIASVAWFDRLARRLARWAPNYTHYGQRVDYPGNYFDPLTGALIGEFHEGTLSARDETRWRWAHKLAPQLLSLVERARALLGTEEWAAARAVHLEAVLLRLEETRPQVRRLARYGRQLSRGRPRGSHSALGRILAPWLAAHPRATFADVWDYLKALADEDHDVVQEVLEGNEPVHKGKKRCHPGAHVHWQQNVRRGRQKSLSAKGLRTLLWRIKHPK